MRLIINLVLRVALLLSIISLSATAEIKLSDTNRMLPLAPLFHSAHNKQISELTEFMLANKPELMRISDRWQVLSIKNNSPQDKQWILTRTLSHQDPPPLLLEQEGSVTAFSFMHPSQTHWPFNALQYQLKLKPGESVSLYTPNARLAPTQLWESQWWQSYQARQSNIIAFSWGALLSLLAIQVCLLVCVKSLPKSLIMIQVISAIILLHETGLGIQLASMTHLNLIWPLLIALGQLYFFYILVPLFDEGLHKKYILLFQIIAGITLLLGLGYINTPTYTLGSAFLISLIVGATYQAGILFYGIQLRYQGSYFSILGIYICYTLLAISVFSHNKVSEIVYLFIPTSALVLLGIIFSLTLLMRRISYSIELETQESKQRQKQAKHSDELLLAQETELKRKLDELEVDHKLLQQKNAIDFLTGIKNRQFFDEKYYKELAISARENKPVGLILIDLDFFKKVNDKYGHQIGDEVLKEIAKRLYFALKRPADSVCRYGGEEFAVILPNTPIQGAFFIAQAIDEAVKSKPILTSIGPLNVTLSQGVAAQIHKLEDPDGKLLSDADKALYRAKSNGRDRIEKAQTKPFLVDAEQGA